MDWHVSLLFVYVFAVLKSLGQRRYLRKTNMPSSVVASMNYVLGIFPLALFVGLILPHHVNWSGWVVFLLVLEGLAIGLFNKFAFRAIKRLPISLFQTLNQSSTIFVILGGSVILGETLSVTQFIGVSLIISAAVLSAFAAKSKSRAHTIEPGTIKLVIIAAAILSIGMIAEKASLAYMDIGAYFIFGIGSQMLFVTLIALKDTNKKVRKAISRSDLRNNVVIGMLSVLGGISYLYTVNAANNISLIVALNSFVLPLTALGSYWLLHEREDQRKLWGSIALGMIGVCITALN
jgi:drug/metabolite transporter (DMT)-like permease